MDNQKKPKLPLDEIHKELKLKFPEHKYFTIVSHKESEEETYVMTNYSREKAKKVLISILESMITNTAIETDINEQDFLKQFKSN